MMGPYIDIPGPEISAGSRMMSWLFDEYSKYKRFSPACVTGKVHDLDTQVIVSVAACAPWLSRWSCMCRRQVLRLSEARQDSGCMGYS